LLYAAAPPARVPGLGKDVRVIRAGLLATVERGRRIRAQLLPPSLRRKDRRSLAERRYALTRRIRRTAH
ncbi:hypothetical protein, partial [Streptomyces sp. SID3343]|uniref:hypothetical protein n=1 Tax=Streptomyces sp. SID3343 TaxID=2690260 RepID=UPI0013712A7D